MNDIRTKFQDIINKKQVIARDIYLNYEAQDFLATSLNSIKLLSDLILES
jgi:hypothetical protein